MRNDLHHETANEKTGVLEGKIDNRTFELSDVVAALNNAELSLRSTGIDISVRYSTAFAAAFRKDSAITVGWMPFCNIFSAAPRKLPARTTTDVVPSPASTS